MEERETNLEWDGGHGTKGKEVLEDLWSWIIHSVEDWVSRKIAIDIQRATRGREGKLLVLPWMPRIGFVCMRFYLRYHSLSLV